MKHTFILLLLTLCFFTYSLMYAQAPLVEWQKCLGSYESDNAKSIEPTADGGYIIGGYTNYEGADVMGYHGNRDIGDYWIAKTDATGNIQWQKCLGGTYTEIGAYVRQTPDGGYIVAGSSASSDCNIMGNHGGLDFWIVKLGATGDIQWQKSLGGSKNDYALALDFALDGGYIIAGHTESSDGDIAGNHGFTDYWVIKLDIAGNLEWQNTLGGTGADEAYAVKTAKDGGFIIAGFTESNNGNVSGNHGQRDFWVVKLDKSGKLEWQKCLGGSRFDVAWSVQNSMDGGFVVAGNTSSNDNDVSGNHHSMGPFSDYWVVKLAANGTLQWQKCYGGNFNEIGRSVQPTADGGYIVAGSAESSNGDITCNQGATDSWIIKLSSSGVIEWQKSVGGNYFDDASYIQNTGDGGYIMVGTTCSKNLNGYHEYASPSSNCGDYWIVKLAGAVTNVAKPSVSIDPASVRICAGVNATLTAASRYAGVLPAYRWTKNGISAGTNSSSYTAADFKDNDVIICFLTTGGSCDPSPVVVSDTAIIKVSNSQIYPAITITADNTIICNCTPVTLTANVSNAGGSPVYRWKVNGSSTDFIGTYYTSNALKAGDVITCTYLDNTSCVAGGSVTSNAVQMVAPANSPLSAKIAASSTTVCSGASVYFTATALNAGTNPVYQWRVNGVKSGSNSNSFILDLPTGGDIVTCFITADPQFKCVLKDTLTSNMVVLTVMNKLTPQLAITSSATASCSGMPVSFTAKPLNAGSNPAYNWKVNGVAAGTNNPVFTTSTLLNGDRVTCSIIADPLFACITGTTANSNEIQAVVSNALSTVTITASNNDVCSGTAVNFSAFTSNAGVSPSYQWFVNGLPVNNNTNYFTGGNLMNGDKVSCSVKPDNTVCGGSAALSNDIVMRFFCLACY